MSGTDQNAYLGQAQAADTAGPVNPILFAIRQQMARMAGATLVQVKAVSATGLEPVGFVDALPMVQQTNGRGMLSPMPMIHNLPYFRLQGGKSAVIVDPAIGDIGLAVFASRDISNIKQARAPSGPGSHRIHSWSDGLYIGGFLNGSPEEYIWLTSNGVKVQTKGEFSVSASKVTFDCDITTSGDVKAAGISLTQHTHPGVQPGSGATGTPE
ncbi:Gp138 family membrane-puncturing spike protein [Acetobacter sp. P5B1]|uniref:Gp138 family membrane-puncturing spike protein n=1 Tax=Acetobacter sp. P5B1 TaxID=2762620 RepID=UPI00207B5F14|nr:Gp138 family membrane-puncturing spike protein [Acetobacter sp. P5B1]